MQLVSLYITSSLSILSAAEAREMKGIIHLLTKNIFFSLTPKFHLIWTSHSYQWLNINCINTASLNLRVTIK